MVFGVAQLIKGLLMFSTQISTGLIVKHKGVKVNYTRKLNHFVLFLVPVLLDSLFPYEHSVYSLVTSAIIAVIPLLMYVKPIRSRNRVIALMFLSFDRPEDRPHTLRWLITQTAIGYLIMVPMGVIYLSMGLEFLIFIPILINGLGDGLAEPIGVRFGRHSYSVRALFTEKKYVRTVEGSLCVYFASILIIILFGPVFPTQFQLILALLIIPIVMTAAEAVSPHTWDTPLLFLTGYVSLLLIVM
ncbi:MAG: hypothetical protein RTU63_03470 [Candidatus Thorarchaeota archaeon]